MAKHCILTLLAGAIFISSATAAAPPCDTLLPATAKGFVSIPDVEQFRAKWDETQLGQLANDPLMKPFIEDLRDQFKRKFSKTRGQLGVTLEDLDGIYGGELCIATLQPDNDSKKHAMALLVDITDHEERAAEVVKKITQNLTDQGAKKRTETIATVPASVFTLARKRPEDPVVEVIYVTHRNLLIATNHQGICEHIVESLNGKTGDSFDQLESYAATMKRCASEAGEAMPHVRWYIDPIGYAQVLRAADGGRKKRGTDLLKVLPNQGFDAIRGLGGHVFFSTGDQDILHRTMIYAPRVQRSGDDASDQRYNLAARMLDFPNTENMQPQAWVSRDLGSYYTFNWKMVEAFEYSKTLVNEMLGGGEDDDLLEDIIRSLAEDKDGPQVDLRKDLVHHFAERASVLADCRRPITPDSERLMFAIELTDPEAVRTTINKMFDADADAAKREFEGHIIWEILTDDSPADVEAIQVEGPGFDPFFQNEEPEETPETEEKRILPNSAITVAHGHLVVATHVDFVIDLLRRPPGIDLLEDAADYQQVQDALSKIGGTTSSFRFFTRTDEAYRPTFELIRQGKMPESKTLFGRLLNRVFGPDEEGILREQQIDGTKMPEFDAVRRYLGPAGMVVQSEEDGWFLAGCLLSKDLP